MRWHRVVKTAALALFGVGISSCGGAPGLPPEEPCAVAHGLTTTSSGGPIPTFNWSPPCPVALFVIADSGSCFSGWWGEKWRLTTLGQHREYENRIVPPVKYDSVPPGLYELHSGALPRSYVYMLIRIPSDWCSTTPYPPQPLASGTLFELPDLKIYNEDRYGPQRRRPLFRAGDVSVSGPLPDRRIERALESTH